jgi:hypothetical protein
MAFVKLSFARQYHVSHSAVISLSELKLHNKSKTFDYQNSVSTIKLHIIQLLKASRILLRLDTHDNAVDDSNIKLTLFKSQLTLLRI